MPCRFPSGFAHYPLYFGADEQIQLIRTIQSGVRQAPFFQPTMPRTGKPLSVVMSNFGPLGWVTDKVGGYRYEPTHPKTGRPWPRMPDGLSRLWFDVTNWPTAPEACLINWYRAEADGGRGARMGMHVDRDEQDLNAPVVSVSLGDPALYRIGRETRGGPTQSVKLFSGDVVVLAGAARRSYHGVSKVYYGESALIPNGGRVNLTMRIVGQTNSS